MTKCPTVRTFSNDIIVAESMTTSTAIHHIVIDIAHEVIHEVTQSLSFWIEKRPMIEVYSQTSYSMSASFSDSGTSFDSW